MKADSRFATYIILCYILSPVFFIVLLLSLFLFFFFSCVVRHYLYPVDLSLSFVPLSTPYPLSYPAPLSLSLSLSHYSSLFYSLSFVLFLTPVQHGGASDRPPRQSALLSSMPRFQRQQLLSLPPALYIYRYLLRGAQGGVHLHLPPLLWLLREQ